MKKSLARTKVNEKYTFCIALVECVQKMKTKKMGENWLYVTYVTLRNFSRSNELLNNYFMQINFQATALHVHGMGEGVLLV